MRVQDLFAYGAQGLTAQSQQNHDVFCTQLIVVIDSTNVMLWPIWQCIVQPHRRLPTTSCKTSYVTVL